jgi:hypothetical protein
MLESVLLLPVVVIQKGIASPLWRSGGRLRLRLSLCFLLIYPNLFKKQTFLNSVRNVVYLYLHFRDRMSAFNSSSDCHLV